MINKKLNDDIRRLRLKNLRKTAEKTRVKSWLEKDVLEGEVVDAGVIILPTIGCRWGRLSGCSMCGYVYESGDLDDDTLGALFQKELDSLGNVRYLKLFTSGSFFDPEEVSSRLMDTVVKEVNRRDIKLFGVESRPEFLKNENLSVLQEELNGKIEVGIGLETSNDNIRRECINKGFTFADYQKAVEMCNHIGVLVKTYLLFKPPFILEREAIDDTVKSIKDASESGTDKISINPMNVQRGTFVETMWKRGEYRTPWLWSLVEVLKSASSLGIDVPVLSHPTGAGTRRGAHNCGVCDKEVTDAIRRFSLEQDPQILEGLSCDCKEHWNADHLL